MWDVTQRQPVQSFQQHTKRVWSTDFSAVRPNSLADPCWLTQLSGHSCSLALLCDQLPNSACRLTQTLIKTLLMPACLQADPCSFASGGDDGTVRLWSLRQSTPTACVDARANVCSVQWSPTNPHLLAFGSANYRAFVYDRRQVRLARLLSA